MGLPFQAENSRCKGPVVTLASAFENGENKEEDGTREGEEGQGPHRSLWATLLRVWSLLREPPGKLLRDFSR